MGDPKDSYRVMTNNFIIAFCCIFPFIVFPFYAQMPKSVNSGIDYYTAVDLFEFFKFIFLIFTASAMFIITYFKKRYTNVPVFVSLPLLVFVGFAFLAAVFSVDVRLSFVGLSTKWQGIITYLCYLNVFIFVYNHFQKKFVHKYVFYLLFSSSIVGGLALFSYGGLEIYYGLVKLMGFTYDHVLIKAPIGNRISLGAYFSLFLPMSLFCLLTLDKKKVFYIVYYFFTTILNFSGLLISQCRTAWIGVFLGVVIISIYEYKTIIRNFKAVAISLVILVVVFGGLNASGRSEFSARIKDFNMQLKKALTTGDSSTFGSMRGFIYSRAFLAAKENPLLGVGPDCFMYYGILTPKDYAKYPEWRNTTIITKAHSEYLEIAATMGYPALIAYLAFLVTIIFAYMKRRYRNNKFLLPLFAGFLSYIIQAAANIGVISVLPIFITVCAIILRCSGKITFDKRIKVKIIMEKIINNLMYIKFK